ncbi:hypothetical protein THRCLA_06585 [Thraustotheca clavata]|uniref:Uncharacterized protein n=1 Tax=Thraustotheca clavata TaxID=74557 RepID=A0A1V9ZMG3_9STRA|nr:hypothetical protein THRCLA_06585 [Thraustotheca clavata]
MESDGAITTSTSRGYMMDFGNVFLRNEALNSVEERTEANESMGVQETRTSAMFQLGREIKPWQLPEFNTIEENAAYLNRQIELQHIGHDVPFKTLVFGTESNENDVRQVMDCVHWLLHSRREEIHRYDQLIDQFAKLEKDVARKTSQLQALNIHFDTERKKNADLENLMAAKEAAIAREKQNYQAEKRALERKCVQLQHVDSNYKAQLRKAEVQYERLQKQYNQHLSKPSTDKRGMSIGKELNNRPDCLKMRKDANKKTTGEHQIFNKMLKSYEEQHSQLLSENDKLRKSLTKFYSELKQLTVEFKSTTRWLANQQGPSSDVEVQLQLNSDDISSNMFTMPLNASGNNLISAIEGRLETLREKVTRLKEIQQERHLDALQTQLQDALHIIREQDKMIHLAIKETTSPNADSRLELSQLEEMMETLAHEKQVLAIKDENMESERLLFTQQAEKLDHDRLAFEKFRQEIFLDMSDTRIRPDSKKRHRSSTGTILSPELPSPVSLLGLPLPPTPETTRLLQQIGFDKHGKPMSPIASTGQSKFVQLDDLDHDMD